MNYRNAYRAVRYGEEIWKASTSEKVLVSREALKTLTGLAKAAPRYRNAARAFRLLGKDAALSPSRDAQAGSQDTQVEGEGI